MDVDRHRHVNSRRAGKVQSGRRRPRKVQWHRRRPSWCRHGVMDLNSEITSSLYSLPCHGELYKAGLRQM